MKRWMGWVGIGLAFGCQSTNQQANDKAASAPAASPATPAAALAKGGQTFWMSPGGLKIFKDAGGGENKPCKNCVLDFSDASNLNVVITMDADDVDYPFLPMACAVIQTYDKDGEFHAYVVLESPPATGFEKNETYPSKVKSEAAAFDAKKVKSASIHFIGTKFEPADGANAESRPVARDDEGKIVERFANGFDKFTDADGNEVGTSPKELHETGKKCSDFY